MCGIVGYLSETKAALGHETLRRMAAAIAHRGPDGHGVWTDDAHGIGLGHRRLAIIDLSSNGHQPMASDCGRYIVVFNGEIYNHPSLRRQLGERPWRGASDTETLLACFSQFGIEATLGMAVGMFAFAVWDTERRELVLARDRMGEKPLYYGTLPSGEFVFGSELRALRAHPAWKATIDRCALTLFLRHNCIPAPWSVYEGIRKLSPGCFLTVSLERGLKESVYWSVAQVARAGEPHRRDGLSDQAATDRLEALLAEAVNEAMLSDVPLGAFLSGGVDSSTIVALMTRNHSRVRTFSIGFSEPGYNEAEYAKAVAAHLKTEHTELYVQASDAIDVVPKLSQIYDEPFADSSQLPTFLVAQMARKYVTVSLSGDGGDELFAGYSRYRIASNMWRRLHAVPLGLRRRLASGALKVPPHRWDAWIRRASFFAPGAGAAVTGDRLHKFAANVLTAEDQQSMYRALVSHWPDPSSVVLNATEPKSLLDDRALAESVADPVERMSLTDQVTYLPDDILVKVDRAAMAVSLETRAPLLDRRVVEFAWQIPMHQKIRQGQTKWLLRQVLYRFVPQALIERPKQGFGVPLDAWLRGPLRDWADALLSPRRLCEDGLFDVSKIREKWDQHLSGERNWHYLLWDVLMFQAWLDGTRARV